MSQVKDYQVEAAYNAVQADGGYWGIPKRLIREVLEAAYAASPPPVDPPAGLMNALHCYAAQVDPAALFGRRDKAADAAIEALQKSLSEPAPQGAAQPKTYLRSVKTGFWGSTSWSFADTRSGKDRRVKEIHDNFSQPSLCYACGMNRRTSQRRSASTGEK